MSTSLLLLLLLLTAIFKYKLFETVSETFGIYSKKKKEVIAIQYHIITTMLCPLNCLICYLYHEKRSAYIFCFSRARLDYYIHLTVFRLLISLRFLFINLIQFVYIEIFSLIIFIAQPLRLKLIQIKMSFSHFSYFHNGSWLRHNQI